MKNFFIILAMYFCIIFSNYSKISLLILYFKLFTHFKFINIYLGIYKHHFILIIFWYSTCKCVFTIIVWIILSFLPLEAIFFVFIVEKLSVLLLNLFCDFHFIQFAIKIVYFLDRFYKYHNYCFLNFGFMYKFTCF